jgi:hypothetical protein
LWRWKTKLATSDVVGDLPKSLLSSAASVTKPGDCAEVTTTAEVRVEKKTSIPPRLAGLETHVRDFLTNKSLKTDSAST